MRLSLLDRISQNASNPPVSTNQLILDDGINPPTVIDNPVGDYTYVGDAWVTITANSCPNLTGLSMDLAFLTTVNITNCPALVNFELLLAPGVTSLDLTGMSTTASNVYVDQCDNLASIDISTFTSMSGLQASLCGNLTTISAGALTSVTGSVVINGCSLFLSLNFPLLASISSSLVVTSNLVLDSILAPSLTSVGILTVTGNALSALSLPALTTITGSATITSESIMTSLNLTSLTSVGADIYITSNGSLASMSVESIVTIGGSATFDSLAVTDINLTDLTSVVGTLTVTSNAILDNLDASNLLSVGGDVNISSVNNSILFTSLDTVGLSFTVIFSGMAAISCNAITSIGGSFIVGSNPNLTDLNLFILASPIPGDIVMDNSPSLVTFTMNGQSIPNNGQTINFNGSGLDQASVDLILAAGVAGGMSSGSIDLSGGTNSTPSAAGLADAATLTTNGVIVTTN